MNYIKLDNLKDGYTYTIDARNASVGIYLKKNKSFLISRIKFSDNYLFEEYHWDTGEPFGTVKPIEEIEKAPFEFELDQRIEDEQEQQVLKYLNTIEGTRKTRVFGKKYIVDDEGIREEE